MQFGNRLVLDAHAQFLDHHIALWQHFLVGEFQIGHAVGFHLHDERQPVFGDGLKISREIIIGESIVTPAIARNRLGEFTGRELVRALEHQMFEKMRQPRLARHFVCRANAIPDHMGHNRRTVIRNNQNLHPVGQRESFRCRRSLGYCYRLARPRAKKRGTKWRLKIGTGAKHQKSTSNSRSQYEPRRSAKPVG